MSLAESVYTKNKYNCLNEINNYTGFCIENGNEWR